MKPFQPNQNEAKRKPSNAAAYAFFALLFGCVALMVAIVDKVQSSPFEGGCTADGVVTAIETRGDGIITKKESFSQIEFTDSKGQLHHAGLSGRIQVGTRIQLSYRSSDPTTIRRLDGAMTPKVFYGWIIVGSFLTFTGALTLLVVRLSRSRENADAFEAKPAVDSSVNWKRRVAFAVFIIGMVILGFISKSAQPRELQAQAEVVKSPNASLKDEGEGFYVRYTNEKNVTCYAHMNSNAEYEVGDTVVYNYRPEGPVGMAETLKDYPWAPQATVVLLGLLLAVVIPKELVLGHKRS